ncbi:hypothetical protein AB9K26_00715 [Psychroserpens sp. XS_ASV72]|uniref:hypothetical protein n=1 Tax=Psychroserpens sp. XS_ASV72 TaxID=3241293 RepID=UPI0035137379
MEVAVQSIFVLFFVALPGVIFRRFYFQGEFTKQFDSKGWSHSLFLSLVFGLAVHLVLIFIYFNFNLLISIENFNIIYDSLEFRKEPIFDNKLKVNLLYWYLSLLFIAPMLFGYALHSLVRYTNLDMKSSLFRFSNHWHYYFKGEIGNHKDFKELKNSIIDKKFIATNADVLCKRTDTEAILYSGLLNQYTICKQTGNLQYIYLTHPKKHDYLTSKDLSSVQKDSNINFQPFPSHCLIIPKSEILNINLRYVFTQKKYKDYSNFFKIILYVIYSINWIEPLTIFKFGIVSGTAIKLLRHLFIFAFINAVHSTISKKERENRDAMVGFWWLTLITVGTYLISRYFLFTTIN